MPATRMSFSYPEELKDKIMAEAKRDNRSLSSMIQIFILEGLKRREVKRRSKKIVKN